MCSDESIELFLNEAKRHFDLLSSNTTYIEKQLKKVDREIENINKAIAQGIFTSSTKTVLEASEKKQGELMDELEQIRKMNPELKTQEMLKWHQKLVNDLNQVNDVDRAREAVRALLGGEIILHPIEEEGILEAEIKQGNLMVPLLDSNGSGGRI